MSRTRKLEVILAGDSSGAERSMSSTANAAGNLESRIGAAGRAASGSGRGFRSLESRLKSFGTRARSAGRSMTAGLTLPIVGFGILAARELSEGETALAQTQAVIESTGGAAQKTVGDIVELAGSLSEMSSIDDEDIQGLANTLLTFRQIAGDTFNQATEAALDLSVAMGTDLHAAGIQVGKALNDPIRGLTSLTRAGVTFNDEQRSTIEAMVAFGDTAGAQQIILHELNAEFGGSAEALGETLTGRLNRAKHRFEELGASILTNLMPVIETLAGFVETLADKFENLTPTQQKWVSALILAAAVVGPLVTTIGALSSAVGFLVSPIGLVILAVVGLGIAIFVLVQHWELVKAAFTSFWQMLLDRVPGLQTLVLALGQAWRGISTALSVIGSIARTVWNDLFALGSVTFGALIAGVQAIYSAIASAVGAASTLLGLLSSIGDQQSLKNGVPVRGDSMNSVPDAFPLARALAAGRAPGVTRSPRVRPQSRRVLPAPVIIAGNLT